VSVSKKYDCIVLGLGAMGSSAAYQLSKRKKKVLGIEQFTCAHDKGSSHGETRLIRKAYFEHPDYVPLLERSYELWKELEQVVGKKLLHETGLIILGEKNQSPVLAGVKQSSEKYKIPIQIWDRNTIQKLFPQAHVPENYEGIFEKTGGYLEVENCVRAFCEAALQLGADLRFEEKILGWKKIGSEFEVTTSKGKYFAEKILLTAGPWTASFLKGLEKYFKVHRAPLFWFESKGDFRKENGVPCYAFDTEEGFFYGFTEKDGMIKIALHLPLQEVMTMDGVERKVTFEDEKPVVNFVKKYLKGISPEPKKSALCFYTMSPDTHFILDEIPDKPGGYFGGGFSGHGFKFSSLIGEVLADWVCEGNTRHPVEFLKMKRFKREL